MVVHRTSKQKGAAAALPLEEGAVETLPAEAEAETPEEIEDEKGTPSKAVHIGFAGDIEPKTSVAMEALRQAVGANHTDIIDVCREPKGGDGHACKRYALDPFFDALDALEKGERKDAVRIVHFGDSLIASDYISDVLRRRLQKRFGNGGAGFLFVDRPSRFGGLKTRAGDASAGFEITKVPEPLASDGLYGFAGVSFQARSSENTRYNLRGAQKATLFYLAQPGGQDIDVVIDGKDAGKIPTVASVRESATAMLPIKAGDKRLEIKTKPGTRLYGVALERGPGVTLESIGLPGAYAGAYLKIEEQNFRTSLAARKPDLNIIMLGGNESLRLDNGWASADAIRKELEAFVSRVTTAAPDAACLVVSPFASGVSTVGAEIRVRKETRVVAAIFREVAATSGCAFWDALQAEGGETSILRFTEARLMNADLVHPVRKGADLLGHLFETALQRAYFVRHGPDALADPPGIIDPSGRALSRIFDKMSRLEKDKRGRVAMVQLGASHTAGHMFTDEMRALLQARFGDAGRGFVAAGAPSHRLKQGKVTRQLSRGWSVRDAMHSQAGEYWGLTGIRAVGRPQASMEIGFCEGCQSTKLPVVLQLHYLEEPGMGRIEVRVDNKIVAVLPDKKKGPASKEPVARVFTVKAKGQTHAVKVRNIGDDEITIFGVSEEIERPGLVYDALGLPGATAVVADGFEKTTFEAQLRERAADLYVLFYGTNESALSRFDAFEYKRRYVSFLDSLMRASPEADCLIMGPTDRMAPDDTGVWREVGSLRAVIAALRQVAEARGCAFWSPRAAMGGKDSIERWLERDPAEAHADHVHLNEIGYAALARMMTRELLDAYSASLVSK
jgi:lysophospholipase L1-like esterase